MTIQEFANQYPGDTLSILYKDGEQVGFVRTSTDTRGTTIVLPTDQNIELNPELHPEQGLLTLDLNTFRNG